MKTWRIDETGTYLDEELISNKRIKEYSLAEGEYISVRIGVKEDAPSCGRCKHFRKLLWGLSAGLGNEIEILGKKVFTRGIDML